VRSRKNQYLAVFRRASASTGMSLLRLRVVNTGIECDGVDGSACASVAVTAGSLYMLQVDGELSSRGDFTLSWLTRGVCARVCSHAVLRVCVCACVRRVETLVACCKCAMV
jgi:hypothetical protein